MRCHLQNYKGLEISASMRGKVELTITVSKCADFGCRAALVQHGNIRLPEYLQDLMPMGGHKTQEI
jgi:hypothetical protein